MAGEKNYISKAMCMFVSMDKMVGGDFEKGLDGFEVRRGNRRAEVVEALG